MIKVIITWLGKNRDALTVIIAIGSITVTSLAWFINHEFQQNSRITLLERRITDLNRDFSLYHRNFLIAEQVEVEQEIKNLNERRGELTQQEQNRLIDLLVRLQILKKEISDLSG